MSTPSGDYASLAELAASSSPDTSTPAYSNTAAPAIQFATANIQPPGGMYVTNAFSLRVTAWSSDPAVTGIAIAITMLMPDGTVHQISEVLAPVTSDRVTLNVAEINLPECFLLGVSIYLQGANSSPGRVYALAQLETGQGASAVIFQTLAAGYVTGNCGVAWPNSPIRSSTEGTGYIQTVDFTPAGFDTEAVLSVPTGAIWDVRSIRCQFITSAVSVDRVPSLIVQDVSNPFQVQLASAVDSGQSVNYVFVPGMSREGTVPPYARPIAIANPAAGADFTITVPAGRTWEILGVAGQFTTSAVAGNRTPSLFLQVRGNPAGISITSGAVIPASQGNNMCWGIGLPAFGPLDGTLNTALPQRMLLNAGDKLGSSTAGILAGDQWSNIYLWVNETFIQSSINPLPLPCRLLGGQQIHTSTAGMDAGDRWASCVALVEEFLVRQQ